MVPTTGEKLVSPAEKVLATHHAGWLLIRAKSLNNIIFYYHSNDTMMGVDVWAALDGWSRR